MIINKDEMTELFLRMSIAAKQDIFSEDDHKFLIRLVLDAFESD